MIYPFETRFNYEEQWPDFEPITKENAALRFRQYLELSDYIKEVGINYMKGNDIKRYERGNTENWKIKFSLKDTHISFKCEWVSYFRGEYDSGDIWNFDLNYDTFILEESKILELGAKEKEKELIQEKKIEEDRRKKEKEAQEKRNLEIRKKV